MLKIFKTVAALGLVVINVACVPIPHSESVAPALQGILIRDGHPVPDAVISIIAERSSKQYSVTTDSAGTFSTPELIEWQLMFPIFGDYNKIFDVNIQVGDARYKGWSQIAWYGGSWKAVTLTCDLNKPHVDRNGQTMYCDANQSEK